LYYKNAFYKNKLIKIKNKVFVKFKIYNVSNFELAILREDNFSNILNNNLDNFNKLKN